MPKEWQQDELPSSLGKSNNPNHPARTHRHSYGEVLNTVEHRDEWGKVQRHSGSKGWIARRLV